MTAYGGVDVYIHIFLTSALVGVEWSASRLGPFNPGDRALGTHLIECLGPRTGLDDMEERKVLPLPELGLHPLCRPARSHSLYRLRYPGSVFSIIYMKIMLMFNKYLTSQ
jgi:hypothetical protein